MKLYLKMTNEKSVNLCLNNRPQHTYKKIKLNRLNI